MQPRHYISQFPFDARQVRLLLYRECDNRGRRLLFDSNALQKGFLQSSAASTERNKKVNKDENHKTITSNASPNTFILKGVHTNNAHINNVHTIYNKSSSNCSSSSSCTNSSNIIKNGSRNNDSFNNNFKQKSNVKVQIQKQQQQQQQHHHLHHNNHQKQSQQQPQPTHSKDFVELCNEYGYKHNRNNSAEIVGMGEMVFGALAMSFRGPALKLHWLEDPTRILLSQVFLTPHNNQIHGSHSSSISSSYSYTNLSATPRTSISSEHSSLDGLSVSSLSLPYAINVGRLSIATTVDSEQMGSAQMHPEFLRSSRYSSTYSMGTDSGYSGQSSSLGSGCSSGTGKSDALRKLYINNPLMGGTSLGSNYGINRRINRNICTSFENEYSYNDLVGFTDDYNQYQAVTQGGSEGRAMDRNHHNNNSSHHNHNNNKNSTSGNGTANDTQSNPEMSKRRDNCKVSPRRAKLGLAICITLSESFKQEMDQFCSEHAALLESLLTRVRAYTEQAYINHKDFVVGMYKIWQDTQQWLNDFFSAPRIQCPVWLSVTTSGSKYSKNVAECFVKELCWLLALADTKDTNFFISTMLTATLTHHLGWVATVLNGTGTSSAECNVAATEQRAKLLQISQSYPYNALWAQMGDLFGSIGVPPKLTRTIIYGTQKLHVERLLNILTFFIRCSEVRYTVKREIFSKQNINFIINQHKLDLLKQQQKSSQIINNKKNSTNVEQFKHNGGLSRTQTVQQSLATLYDDSENVLNLDANNEGYIMDENALALNMKKNEIPNVLAFRDSRFVQQELRIGNFLMDTGIEKSAIIQHDTDENERDCNEGKALEAIEIDFPQTTTNSIDKSCKFVRRKSKNFFWNIVPHALRDGLCLNEQTTSLPPLFKRRNSHLKHCTTTHNSLLDIDEQKINEDTTTISNIDDDQYKLMQTLSFTSLSDLITQNSIGKSDRMTWGVEPMKENICLEEQMHFDLSKLMIEREHVTLKDCNAQIIENNDTDVVVGFDNNDDNTAVVDINEEQHKSMDVLFVLGDNEPLVNLKRKNNDNLQQQKEIVNVDETTITKVNDKKQMLCAIHQRTHDVQMNMKKHSGVKFNFEQYPQIATNYMKSKNLILSHFNLLIDKPYKLNDDDAQIPTHIFPTTIIHDETDCTINNTNNDCIVCSSILRTYQTPSNATELEFETDQMHCFATPTTQQQQPKILTNDANVTQHNMLHTVSSVTSVETLKSAENLLAPTNTAIKLNDDDFEQPPPQQEQQTSNYKDFEQFGKQTYTKIPSTKNQVHPMEMPLPNIKDLRAETVDDTNIKIRTGFIPSMFLSFSDHYVSGMILQGTCAPPALWENTLREDLALAARSGALISVPMENVAIIADMERWDVRLISSQTQTFPNTSDHSAPVGMSQLVSTMLETVQTMNNVGISAYDCLAYIESKLHEIYLHSESLATFLLETDICPLSFITRALNISENDVPLLLSIASVHTPQISRKCGISFR